MGKCIVLAGNYGSGKTELALNMALCYSKKGDTVLADMDIVNPYFRSAEHGEMLSAAGVKLIAPTFANTTVDVPAISAEVFSAFEHEYAVFDAGGDPVGSAVLGSISAKFPENTLFYYVINARRPFQRTAEDAVEMLLQIQDRARLKITGLINNTNLARETAPEDILFGQEMCAKITKATGLPLLLTSGEVETLKKAEKMGLCGETFPIKIYTRPPWLDITAD